MVGLVHGFGQKFNISSPWRFSTKLMKRSVWRHSCHKNSFSFKNSNIRKLQNLHFSRGVSPVFWSKIWNFLMLTFLAKLMKKVFENILNRKIAFLDYKNIAIRKVHSLLFSKGDSPWFWSKIQNFSTLLFLGKTDFKKCWRNSWWKKSFSTLINDWY